MKLHRTRRARLLHFSSVCITPVCDGRKYVEAPKHGAHGVNSEFVKRPRLLLPFLCMFPVPLCPQPTDHMLLHAPHSERNEAEIHCLRRLNALSMNIAFGAERPVDVRLARTEAERRRILRAFMSKLTVSSAKWFRQAAKACGRRRP